MIGRRLTAFFTSQGHAVAALTRNSYQDTSQLEGVDVVIHLAGANIAERWTTAYKKEILESRVRTTRLLCETISLLNCRPKLLITASAVGYYGNHGPEEILDEGSHMGEGFLADVCQQWEAETKDVSRTIRTVRMRLGVVLSKAGGALAKMRLPFQLGLGGRLGDGRQMMSWVALDEIPHIVEHFIKSDLSGPVNAVSPQAVSNAEFTKVLGQVMHRPTVLPVPAFAVRWLFGEMGQNLLLEGVHVVPRRLQESGYQFRFPELKDALKCLI
jgi:uncharacterized protein (TIGR01777 family)